jgi:hypothetical protein
VVWGGVVQGKNDRIIIWRVWVRIPSPSVRWQGEAEVGEVSVLGAEESVFESHHPEEEEERV